MVRVGSKKPIYRMITYVNRIIWATIGCEAYGLNMLDRRCEL